MDAGIGGSFRKLMSAAEGVALAIGDALAPTLKTIATFVTENLGVWTEWIEQNKGIILLVASIKVEKIGGHTPSEQGIAPQRDCIYLLIPCIMLLVQIAIPIRIISIVTMVQSGGMWITHFQRI